MKKHLGILFFIIQSTAFAADDLYEPKTLSSETFSAVLYAENGAIHCQDKVHSSFADLPGKLYLSNRGGRFGDNRVSDRGDRVSRIEYFSMTLPDSVSCKDIQSKIPTGNDWVQVTRDLRANLVKGQAETRLVISELVKVPIAEGLILEGSYAWNDFLVSSNEINPLREVTLQLLDRDSWQETFEIQIHNP